MCSGIISDGMSGEPLLPDEFMNSKKAHEVPAMAGVVAALSRYCKVKQVGSILLSKQLLVRRESVYVHNPEVRIFGVVLKLFLNLASGTSGLSEIGGPGIILSKPSVNAILDFCSQ